MLKTKMRKKLSLPAAFLLCCFVLLGCGPVSDTNGDDGVLQTEAGAPVTYEYDALQTIFMKITPDTTMEEVEAFIADSGLCYTRKEYNQVDGGKSVSYKIAYTDGVAKQSHADSGDYLDVSFDEESGTLMTAFYSNTGTIASALLYCHGDWYDFSDANAEDYGGYYLSDPLAREDGITVKYENGREAQTHYFPYPSAEELIRHMIDEQK